MRKCPLVRQRLVQAVLAEDCVDLPKPGVELVQQRLKDTNELGVSRHCDRSLWPSMDVVGQPVSCQLPRVVALDAQQVVHERLKLLVLGLCELSQLELVRSEPLSDAVPVVIHGERRLVLLAQQKQLKLEPRCLRPKVLTLHKTRASRSSARLVWCHRWVWMLSSSRRYVHKTAQ